MYHSLPYFLLRPKYWLGLLSFSLAWLVAKLPVGLQIIIAKSLGRLLLNLSAKHRKIVNINLALCFPDKTESERQVILHQNATMTGLGIIETAACWFSNLQSRSRQTQIQGQEHLEQALSKGKGVILLGFHMTSLEIGSQLLGKKFPIVGMYKPDKDLLLESMMCRGRLRHLKSLIKQNDVRSMIKALKANKIIWYAADQDYGRNKAAVFAPFFGTPASTITATTKFAKLTGASVIPFTQKRINDGKEFLLEIHPPLDNFPGKDELADATQINFFLQEYLTKEPADYIWVHQRFRTRPPGEPSIYPKKK